ncbi:AMP-binding protein [Actinomadura xylanilytica]|uniref:AMP-binding protein n=1 Tax=Actinomadura xylanilytica TaxID=887459 RepID=UPI00255AB387|nr:AMP-binding protein [Actinomadura xylanilytica]MDL4777461.1 AMP-binding protein [Actinomadura xylanilytica]
MEGNLAAVLADRADTYGWRDRPLFHSGAATYSHGEVHDAGARAAGVLRSVGVRPGHRVLIALPDSIAFVAALLGTLRLGAVAVLTGPELSGREHAYVLGDADPRAVVCGPGLVPRFTSVPVLTGDDLADEPASLPDPVPVPAGAAAYVQYTSGTTGDPKGAVHRHTDPAAYHEAMALGALGMVPGDVSFSLSKACYPYGLGATVFFPMFCGGASVLWPDAPTVRGAVEQARRHRPTLLFTVPTWYARLVSGPEPRAVREAFASLRAAASAGEPLLPSLGDRIEEVLGCPVLDGLGSTEVGHTFVSNTVTRRRRGALGVVLDPYEIAVRGEGGVGYEGRPGEDRAAAAAANAAGLGAGGQAAARIGERGALYVRGPSVMIEYLGKPGRTAEALGPDGWLRTGDLVHVDEDGFVHHHGRILDQVTVSGERVLPLEVERILGQHPGVVEVAVIADADADGAGEEAGGGALAAFVVADEVAPPVPVLAEELIGLARERLPEHKVPRSVTFMAELPRTSTGKVRRSALGRAELSRNGDGSLR